MLNLSSISDNKDIVTKEYLAASASNLVHITGEETITGTKILSAATNSISGCGFATDANLGSSGYHAFVRSAGSNPLFGLKAGSGVSFYLQAMPDQLYLGPTSSVATSWDNNGNMVIRGSNRPKWGTTDLALTSDINSGILTISKNGTAVASFNANSNSNVTANIIVPTSASDIGAAPASHDHDSRYYTENEVNTLLGNKADASALNGYVPTSRTINSKALTSDVELELSDLAETIDVAEYDAIEVDEYDISEVTEYPITTILSADATDGQIPSAKAVVDAIGNFVPTTRTINEKTLESDIVLALNDITETVEVDKYKILPQIVEDSTHFEIPTARAVKIYMNRNFIKKKAYYKFFDEEIVNITLEDNANYYIINCDSIAFTYPDGDFDCNVQIKFGNSANVSLPTSSIYIGAAPQFGSDDMWLLHITNGIVETKKVADDSTIAGYLSYQMIATFDSKENAGAGETRYTSGYVWKDLSKKYSSAIGQQYGGTWVAGNLWCNTTVWRGSAGNGFISNEFLNINEPFTIEVRCKAQLDSGAEGESPGGYQALGGSVLTLGVNSVAQNGGCDGGNGTLEFRVYANASTSENKGMQIFVGRATGTNYGYCSFIDYGYDQKEWHTYSVTHNGLGLLRYYGDGILVKTEQKEPNFINNIANWIKFCGSGTNGTNQRFFCGRSTRFAFYKRALTASEIMSNYLNDLSRYSS